jgi:hypothetical protein
MFVTIYVAARVLCEHRGRLTELLGVSTDLSKAIAMCSDPLDAVLELQDGRLYPPNEVIPGGIRVMYPRCRVMYPRQPQQCGWRVASGLSLDEIATNSNSHHFKKKSL